MHIKRPLGTGFICRRSVGTIRLKPSVGIASIGERKRFEMRETTRVQLMEYIKKEVNVSNRTKIATLSVIAVRLGRFAPTPRLR